MVVKSTEHQTSETGKKLTYHYHDDNGKRVHKAKEEFKMEEKIVLYPYAMSKRFGLTRPKIKILEFVGWKALNQLPKDFKTTNGYGFKSQRIKTVLAYIKRRFPKVVKLTFTLRGRTRFLEQSIAFNWGDFLQIVRDINKESEASKRSKKIIIEDQLSRFTGKISKPQRQMPAGELDLFINKFSSFDEISARDVNAITDLLRELPISKVTVTSHFIETREKMDLIYLDDLIAEFEQLMATKNDNEEKWQLFFEKNSWLLIHLFPYQVILRKGKAYVGGKTFENKEGRIVDFLFQTGLKDNFALLEIKTHTKSLLKSYAYRSPDVFSMSDEFSGGINQCLDQKDNFIKEFGKDKKPLDPKTILVIGRKDNLNDNENKCFELIRANQKNVDVVTFDELLAKLKGLYKVLVGEA